MSEQRRKIAKLATDLYAGDILFEKFLSEIPPMDEDELIDELVYLIEHEPTPGGLFGVSKAEYKRYLNQIFSIIEKLKT